MEFQENFHSFMSNKINDDTLSNKKKDNKIWLFEFDWFDLKFECLRFLRPTVRTVL